MHKTPLNTGQINQTREERQGAGQEGAGQAGAHAERAMRCRTAQEGLQWRVPYEEGTRAREV